MLSNISWSEFTGVIIIIVCIYYLAVGLIYYRPEITALLTKKQSDSFLGHSRSVTVPAPSVNIMGETGPSQIEIDHSRYQPALSNSQPDGNHSATDAKLKDQFADIRQGLQVLLPEINEKDNSLDELRIMLPPFLEAYTEIAESRYRGKVNDYILEQCHSQFSLEITEDEINDLW